MRSRVFLFLVFFLQIQFVQTSFAQNESAPTSPSRIMPQDSTSKLFSRSAISLGVFNEVTQYRAATRYDGANVGLSVGFFQHIYGAWNGSLQVAFSKWEAKKNYVGDTPPQAQIAPLVTSSILEYAPNPAPLVGEWAAPWRAFLYGGLGYVQMYKDQTLPTWRARNEGSDMTFTIGTGLKYSTQSGIAVRASVDRWRSLRSFRYSAYRINAGLLFGDTSGW